MHSKRTIFRDLGETPDLAAQISAKARLWGRFWGKVRISDPAACWTWQAYRCMNGYGKIMVARTALFAHRVAWELTHDQIPEGVLVLHRCDNPPCVNPAHLFIGSPSDNMQDMWDKGRHGKRRPAPTGPARGERCHKARLTAEAVRLIRQRREAGVPLQTLADEHGVTKQAIWHVVQRRSWRHV